MRVLVTNDDGIDAPGLHWLARTAADRGCEVVVAAPSSESSGTSAALTAVEDDGRIVVLPKTLDDLDGVPAYAVAGSPAFIALMAISGAFGPAFDLVLSGVNRGANAGRVVLHSGTVGAALTAAVAGLRGVAVSLDVLTAAVASVGSGGAAMRAIDQVDDRARHWATAARFAVDLLPAAAKAEAGTVLNINVPDVPYERLKGIRRGSLARFGQVQMTVVESGEGFVRTALQASGEIPEPGTDLAILADGFACVTAIRALQVSDVDLPGVAD